ncbi:hypothetical protein ACWGPW_04600 [Paenibacillus chitinolyticus]
MEKVGDVWKDLLDLKGIDEENLKNTWILTFMNKTKQRSICCYSRFSILKRSQAIGLQNI